MAVYYTDFYHIHAFFLIQTLIELQLANCSIGENGAQYLANALANNTVIISFTVFSFSVYLAYTCRHLLDLISNRIHYVIKELNIS